MKHKSKDVTARTNPYMPPTHNTNIRGAVREQSPTPARRAERIQPPTPVSGFGETGIRSRESTPPSFELPETVSAADIKAQSFRYGGGRSAGNRSLSANMTRKINEQ
jgi:hypothetical protein